MLKFIREIARPGELEALPKTCDASPDPGLVWGDIDVPLPLDEDISP